MSRYSVLARVDEITPNDTDADSRLGWDTDRLVRYNRQLKIREFICGFLVNQLLSHLFIPSGPLAQLVRAEDS